MSCGALSQMYELLQRGDYLISYRALLTDIRSSFGTHAALLRIYRALWRIYRALLWMYRAFFMFDRVFLNGLHRD